MYGPKSSPLIGKLTLHFNFLPSLNLFNPSINILLAR